jgi:excisionase family DNA binding protein
MTVADAAVFLRVSESIVRRLIKERRIPFFQIEGRYLFYRPVLEQWMTEISVKPDGQSGKEQATVTADNIWEQRR